MKRFKHNLSHYRLATMDMGKLVPINLIETIPGDTFQLSTSALIRVTPMLAPIMHPVTVRIHHWFVPFRLLWDDWEDFITGGPDGEGAATAFPTNGTSLEVVEGSLFDHLGVRPATYEAGLINSMPVRAYNKIYNEWYRDQDLIAPVNEDQNGVLKVAWEKDYFTSARPWAQKGPAVTLPLGSSAPVVTDGVLTLSAGVPNSTQAMKWKDNGTDVSIDSTQAAGTTEDANVFYLSGMKTDLTNATAVDVREVRLAFALQRYQEARAQYGSRYTEYLRYLGIKPSDARLQRPEYLGGGKQTIAFSEVLRTGNNPEADPENSIGEMAGHGIAALRSNRFRYFCEEHGYIVSLVSVRPKSMYLDSLPRLWSKRTKEEFYQRELELIGQQEIRNSEIFASGTASADNQTFGYQDRYAEYRRLFSQVAGEFRDVLDHWHLGRIFSSLPTLNQSFIDCDPTKRVFAEQTQNSLWCMFNHSIQARRMVGNNTIGRII